MFNRLLSLFKIVQGEGDSVDVFRQIYHEKSWGNSPSVSGTGSDVVQTKEIVKELPVLLKRIGAKTMLDAPCGDYYWMKDCKLKVRYTGIDIVPELIRVNQEKYADEKTGFMLMNIIADELPRVDVIFCRDCLVHFCYKDIFVALDNFKDSRSVYLITTTFPGRRNEDIRTGGWRPINLQAEPFNFPPPMVIINEKCSEGEGVYSDKSLGVWKLSEIPGGTFC